VLPSADKTIQMVLVGQEWGVPQVLPSADKIIQMVGQEGRAPQVLPSDQLPIEPPYWVVFTIVQGWEKGWKRDKTEYCRSLPGIE